MHYLGKKVMEAFQFGRLSRQERESKANISSVNFDGHFVYHGLSLQILRKGESENTIRDGGSTAL